MPGYDLRCRLSLLSVLLAAAGCGDGGDGGKGGDVTRPDGDSGSECTPVAYFMDADGDGAGDPTRSTDACEAPAGYVASGDDCDDADPDFYPGAVERCEDGLDANCDGTDACAEPDVSAVEDVLLGEVGGYAGADVAPFPGGGLAVTGSPEDVVYVWSGPVGGRRSLGESARILRDPEGEGGDAVVAVGDEGMLATSARYGGFIVYGPDADTPSLRYVDCCDLYGTLTSGDLTGDGAPDVLFGGGDKQDHSPAIRIVDASRTGDVPRGDEDALIDSAGTDYDQRYPFALTLSVLGDTDGDGLDDMVVDARWVYRAPLDGVRSVEDADARWDLPFGNQDTAATGDVDGDGLADVLVGGSISPGGATVYRLDHDGVIGAADQLATLLCELPDDRCQLKVWGGFDANQDARPDVAIQEYRDGNYGLWIAHGPLAGTLVSTEVGQHVPAENFPAASYHLDLAAVDLDQNGLVELAIGLPYYSDVDGVHGAVFILAADALVAPAVP